MRRDWAVNVALAATGFVLVGICAISVSLLLDPLIAEFHWKNGAASGLATVYSLAALLSGPIAGIVIDLMGSKRVMVIGVALTAMGYFLLSLCGSLWGFYAAFGVIGTGYGGAFYLACTKLIATRAGEQKNTAMGVWMGAGSVGAAAFSLLVDGSIHTFGWRHTAQSASVFILLMIPVILVVIPRDTHAPPPVRVAASRARLEPLRLFVSPAFLLMSAAAALAAFGMSAIYFHTVPILLKSGFSNRFASAVFGASWVLSGIGSLIGGSLSNRAGTQRVLEASLLLSAIGTVALIVVKDAQFGTAAVLAFIVLWGATANAINQFLPLLLVERFGSAHLGALVGVQGALMGIVGSFAPVVTGSLYDRYSSYAAAILASTVATVLALLVISVLKFTRDAIVPEPAACTKNS